MNTNLEKKKNKKKEKHIGSPSLKAIGNRLPFQMH